MMICWPSVRAMCSPTIRAATSVPPPCADTGTAGFVSRLIRRVPKPHGGARRSRPGPVIRAARRHRSDIPVAARALGTALTDHATVLARAKAAVARIEAGMAWAQTSGVPHEFNQEYRRRRLEAHGRASGSWVTRGRRYGCGGRSPRWRPLAAPRWRSFGGSSSLPDSGPNNKTEPSPCSVAQKSQ